MAVLVIGLTGGLASGKSTVAAMFQSLGVPVIDADAVAREVVAPGEPVLADIRQSFGPDVFQPNGELDRAGLRREIFADPEKRRRLEQLLHPRIHRRILDSLQAIHRGYALLMVPLLVESAQTYPVQRILVVDVPRDLQLRRAEQRDGGDRGTLNGIVAAQADRAERLERADDIIDNTGSLGDLRSQVHRLHRKYLDLAASRAPATGTPLADNSE